MKYAIKLHSYIQHSQPQAELHTHTCIPMHKRINAHACYTHKHNKRYIEQYCCKLYVHTSVHTHTCVPTHKCTRTLHTQTTKGILTSCKLYVHTSVYGLIIPLANVIFPNRNYLTIYVVTRVHTGAIHFYTVQSSKYQCKGNKDAVLS